MESCNWFKKPNIKNQDVNSISKQQGLEDFLEELNKPWIDWKKTGEGTKAFFSAVCRMNSDYKVTVRSFRTMNTSFNLLLATYISD